MEYEVSIRIDLPEDVSAILRKEKERFVAEYGSGYKSEPHITLYIDRYTLEGFSQLRSDLKEFQVEPFTISLLEPEARLEKHRNRYLYVMDISSKEKLRTLHDYVSKIAASYQSALLRRKTQKRLEEQGISTDGTRESLKVHHLPEESFDPHVTLGEIGLGDPQPDLADVRANLVQLEGKEITISEMTVYFYGKEEGAEKFRIIERVTVPLSG